MPGAGNVLLSGCLACLLGALTTSSAWAGRVKPQSPYAKVAWSSVRHVPSASHYHARSQKALDNGYKAGIRHFAISNYYPSVPCTSGEKIGQYKVVQQHATFKNGKLTPGPFKWNEIIMNSRTGWADTLPEKLRKTLPFKVGGPIFPNLPKDIIIAPNAEQHGFADTHCKTHINSLGSTFSTGHFDSRGQYLLRKHYPTGVGLRWREAFKGMLDQLVVADGGGIAINHPRWSGLGHKSICDMLDFDKRVLGIEVWNSTAGKSKRGWSKKEWDAVLATGRRCFGFFVSDHDHKSNEHFLGRNILLVGKFTQEECLRAYRQGRFYGALKGTGLRFEGIDISGDKLKVKTNRATEIRFITAKGTVSTANSRSAMLPLPKDTAGRRDMVYVRVEASDGGGEAIFSQPILFRSFR